MKNKEKEQASNKECSSWFLQEQFVLCLGQRLVRAVCSMGSFHHLSVDRRVAQEGKSFSFSFRCSLTSNVVFRQQRNTYSL